MASRIDPTLPLVWRSPTDLQLGAAQARVILPDAGELETSLITALRHGASDSTLITIGTGLGFPADEVRRLLVALQPALARQPGRGGEGIHATDGDHAGTSRTRRRWARRAASRREPRVTRL